MNWLDTDANNYFIEVAGRAGTDTTGWRVAGVGPSGQLYSDEDLPVSISDSGNGFGYRAAIMTTSTFKSSHGAVLLDASDNIIDYIIWETVTPNPGSLLESGEPVVVSVLDSDAENSSSIQLSGAGAFASNFTWQSPASSTPGNPNTSQTMHPPGLNVCDGALGCINSCADEIQSTGEAAESDIDCGGQCGANCLTGQACLDDADCASGTCTGNVCVD